MKILCCFKVVPDYEMLGQEEWTRGGLPDTRFVRNIYSCYDESALELVLREKDRGGCEAEALTVKKAECVFASGNLYAVGYDRVTELLCADPGHRAEILADYARSAAPDCIVMGCQSQDENGFQTPCRTAELLGWPCIPDVYDFTCAEAGRLLVRQREQGVSRELLVELPCVLSVGNVPKTFLRIPTLRQKMAAKEKSVVRIEREAGGTYPEPVLEDVVYLQKFRSPVSLTAGQMLEMLRKLEDGSLGEGLER